MKKHANLSFFVPHNGCPNQCIFCNQNRISGENHTPTPSEVSKQCDEFLPQKDFNNNTEIAFFGGSFTAIDVKIQKSLLGAALPFVQAGRASGIRISTRPDAISTEILDLLFENRVSAIELGAQSMNDEILEKNRRGHSVADVEKAARLIREYHKEHFSLGLQMMLGLYGETNPIESAINTARQFIALRANTVRIYPTVVIENTPLCDQYYAGAYKPLSVELAAQITAQLLVLFERENISVIRIGLHSDESLRKSAVAGAFHPAFGELCHTLVMRERISELVEAKSASEFCIEVNPSCISRAVGHKRSNIEFFLQKNIQLKIMPNSELSASEIKLLD